MLSACSLGRSSPLSPFLQLRGMVLVCWLGWVDTPMRLFVVVRSGSGLPHALAPIRVRWFWRGGAVAGGADSVADAERASGVRGTMESAQESPPWGSPCGDRRNLS